MRKAVTPEWLIQPRGQNQAEHRKFKYVNQACVNRDQMLIRDAPDSIFWYPAETGTVDSAR